MQKKCNLIAIIGMMISFLFLFSFNSFAQYTDIKDNFAKDAINRWSERGVIQGYQGKFRPDDNITRGELSVILNSILQYENTNEKIQSFKDLKQAFYKEDILNLNSQGIIVGEDSKLRPNDKLTRQEAMVILVRAFNLRNKKDGIKFLDNDDIANWAKESVAILSSNGFINGYQGKINPKENISRAQLILILDNIIDVYIDKDGDYSKEDLKEGSNPNKIAVIKARNLVIRNWETKKNIIVTANKNMKKIHFLNAKFTGDLRFLKRQNEIKVNLENSTIQNIENNKFVNLYADEKTYIANSNIKFKPIEKEEKIEGMNQKEEKNPRYSDEYKSKESNEKSGGNSSNSSSNSQDENKKNDNSNTKDSNIEKKEEMKDKEKDRDISKEKEEKIYNSNLGLLMEGLSSDYKIHLKYTGKEMILPDKFAIINKENGENTGEEIQVKLSGKDLEKLKKGEKGEHQIIVETLAQVIINEKDYERPQFIAVFVIN